MELDVVNELVEEIRKLGEQWTSASEQKSSEAIELRGASLAAGAIAELVQRKLQPVGAADGTELAETDTEAAAEPSSQVK